MKHADHGNGLQFSSTSSVMERERRGRPLYRPLNGEEIRLIEIYPGDWNDPIACQLHYIPLDETPEYVALSYAWGDQSTSKIDICVNGRTRPITQSLYTAIRQLRSFGSTGDDAGPSVCFKKTDPLGSPEPQLNLPGFRLWADALCINQNDDKDREHQIPLMRHIYRCASHVFVWLGENEPQDEPQFRGLSEALLRNNLFKDDDVSFERILEVEENVAAAKQLLLRPWFTRLWVVQEIALPEKQPPLFFAGRNYYSLQSLVSLSWSLDKHQGIDVTPVLWISQLLRARTSLAMLRDTQQPWDMSTAPGAQGFGLSFTTDFSCRFLLIQILLKGFKASRPHDYIYGILGLCGPDALPPTLAPEYEKPFPEVCRDYAVATIKATGSLRVLARQRNGLVGVPSWVPDFSADSTDRLRLVLTESLSARTTKFSPDRSRILIDAYEIGACATIADTSVSGRDRSQILSSLRTFARAIVVSSLATFDNVLKRLAVQYASAIWDYWEHQLNSQGISYNIALAVVTTLFSGAEWPAGLENAGHLDFVSQKAYDELAETALISTAGGVWSFVHRQDASPRHGDLLVAPVNSSFAWLLRGQESNTHSLVSTCNLRQVMAAPYAPLIREDFAAPRRLKGFTIV